MATINRQLADELVKKDGRYKGDRLAYCVVRYQNRTKYDLPGVDLYNPDAPNNCFDYAVFYKKGKYDLFLRSETVGGVDVLWGSGEFVEDERKREEAEESRELAALWKGVVAETVVREGRSGRPRRRKEG